MVRLTKYSHGAGCGCKISPAVLNTILQDNKITQIDPRLLVSNTDRDDAAVYAIDDNQAIISTTDFFMPIVDDPFDFGQIAAVNALSDVYAMGGKPIMAIAILGWPLDKLEPNIAALVINGGRESCRRAGIVLAGGHSIDSPEPIFGLAVTGVVNRAKIKMNKGARPGDLLYLTKALGVGILTTAEKKGALMPGHEQLARSSMLALNGVGVELGASSWVHAMTDVTGFGLGGHLLEMCEASQVTAHIDYVKLPVLTERLDEYISNGCVPGGTRRNWESYGSKILLQQESYRALVCDPQTSGGLVVAVDPLYGHDFEKLLSERSMTASRIGEVEEKGEYALVIN